MATGEQMAAEWMAHRKVAETLLERIPDGKADLRLWPEAMTTAQLGNHIAVAHHMFASLAAGVAFERPDTASLPQDLPGVRALLRRYSEEDAALLRGLGAAALERSVTTRNGEQPAEKVLVNAREHEIHHTGQLFEYARVAGVAEVPPWVIR